MAHVAPSFVHGCERFWLVLAVALLVEELVEAEQVGKLAGLVIVPVRFCLGHACTQNKYERPKNGLDFH